MSTIKVKFGTSANGGGAELARGTGTHHERIGGSIHDMAELLFELRTALRSHPIGQRCLDDVAKRRRAAA